MSSGALIGRVTDVQMGTPSERLHKLEAEVPELRAAGDGAARRLERLEAEMVRLG